MATALSLFAIAVLAIIARVVLRKAGALHPAFLLSTVWCVTILVSAVTGTALGINRPSAWSIAVTLLSVVAFAIGALASRERPKASRDVDWAKGRLILSTCLIFALFCLGAVAFTSGISSAAGSAFSDLTFTEVRRYQTSADRDAGGFVGLLFSLSPLSILLFLLAGRSVSRIWYFGVIPVVLLTTISPGRTIVLTAALVPLLCLSALRQVRDPGRRRGLWVLWGMATVVGALYFVVVGSLLGKDEVGLVVTGPDWLPSQVVSPILYLTGGLSAFGYAIENGLQATEWGRSIYVLMRIGEVVLPNVVAPETIAEFVPIPMDFNVFTAFGDLWLDFGGVGTVVICGTLGVLAHHVHMRAMSGSGAHIWLTALIGGLVVSSPVSFRLMYLDTVFLAVLGAAVFAVVQVREGLGGPIDSPPRRPPIGWDARRQRSLGGHL